MVTLAKALIALAGVAFVLAVVTNFMGGFLTSSEGWSRVTANLALIAIALVLCFPKEGAGRPAGLP